MENLSMQYQHSKEFDLNERSHVIELGNCDIAIADLPYEQISADMVKLMETLKSLAEGIFNPSYNQSNIKSRFLQSLTALHLKSEMLLKRVEDLRSIFESERNKHTLCRVENAIAGLKVSELGDEIKRKEHELERLRGIGEVNAVKNQGLTDALRDLRTKVNTFAKNIVMLIGESLEDEISGKAPTLDQLLPRLREKLGAVEQDEIKSEFANEPEDLRPPSLLTEQQSKREELKISQSEYLEKIQKLEKTQSALISKVNSLSLTNEQQKQTHIELEKEFREELGMVEEENEKLKKQVNNLQNRSVPSPIENSDNSEEERFTLRKANEKLTKDIEKLTSDFKEVSDTFDMDRQSFFEQFAKDQKLIQDLKTAAEDAEKDKIAAITQAQEFFLSFKEQTDGEIDERDARIAKLEALLEKNDIAF